MKYECVKLSTKNEKIAGNTILNQRCDFKSIYSQNDNHLYLYDDNLLIRNDGQTENNQSLIGDSSLMGSKV